MRVSVAEKQTRLEKKEQKRKKQTITKINELKKVPCFSLF